jgi:two-component system NarL family response regulator
MDLDPVRVLIVDDHRLFADSLKLMLDRNPTVDVVGIAGTGAEAVELAVTRDAQVVLMDVGLPDIDGFEATRRLHALKRAAKVIAVSGRSESEVSDEVRDSGMSSFLSKDHIHEHVIDAIASAMRGTPPS